MTVQSNVNREDYVGDGVTVDWDYGFPIFTDSDLVLIHTDADGVDTTLALNTDYTVSNAGDPAGGKVTLLAGGALSSDALTADEGLAILRVIQITQLVNLRNQRRFFPETHEDAFDRLTMIAQQHDEKFDRAISFPESEASPKNTIPSVETRKGLSLGFDEFGKLAVLSSTGTISVGTSPGSVPTNADISVDSLSDLQSYDSSSVSDGFTVYMRGRTSTGDGGEGHHRWNSSDLSTEVGNDEVTAGEGDGGIYVAPAWDKTGASGAWVRQGVVATTLEMYGGSTTAAGTVNSTALKDAYDAAVRNGLECLIPGKTYPMSGAVIFDSLDVVVRGQGRISTLDFSGQASGDCIVLGNSVAPNHIKMSQFNIEGNTSLNGLVINKVGSGINVARTTIDKLWLKTFAIGIKAQYWTTSSCRDVKIESCALGLDAGPQCNDINMDSVWFSNNDRHYDIQNSDNFHFTNPLFQNITDASENSAGTVRQSVVTMDGPYIEGLSNAEIVRIGGSGDTIACTFKINGGRLNNSGNNGDIVYRDNLGHIIEVSGIGSPGDDVRIRTLSTSGSFYLPGGECTWVTDTPKDVSRSGGTPLYEFWWDAKFTFGGASGRRPVGTKLLEVYSTGGATETKLSDSLTPGNMYTLVYTITKPAVVSLALRERTGGAGGTIEYTNGLNVLANGDRLETRYIPFEAIGDTAQLVLTSSSSSDPILIHSVLLLEGAAFPEIDLEAQRRQYNFQAPANGTWATNDIVYDWSPSASGKIGWVCVAGGSPGTWKAFGAIDA